MELEHEFTVPVPVDRAWPTLLDVERVAPCVPGATLDSIDGDEFNGRLKVRLGAMTITYRGTARIVKADESAHVVTIEGTGKEARGSGTASVAVRAELRPETGDETAGESTRVTVHTKLDVTGRPAQFGRNMLSEVGGKLIARFAKALADELAASPQGAAAPRDAAAPAPEVPVSEAPVSKAQAPEAEAAAQVPVAPAPPVRRSEEAIDLLEVAGPSVAKRVAPVAAGVIAVLTVWRVFRRRRGRHHR
ncbi:SRPBCC family protein [Actinomadura alba]|uniref:SRPBCC family protein n=1 Tax=Actinomadura alba TaxID=406431 RepID=A0ABR7LJP4_9ACTN|nr:SRPBCC family protein [Actinomadura alba]MBC6464608.1 SRPBCC family protein [Actinomadura alba]